MRICQHANRHYQARLANYKLPRARRELHGVRGPAKLWLVQKEPRQDRVEVSGSCLAAPGIPPCVPRVMSCREANQQRFVFSSRAPDVQWSANLSEKAIAMPSVVLPMEPISN
jgi:hypothetical protein